MDITLLIGVFVLVIAALIILRRPAKTSDNDDYYNEYRDKRDDWDKQGPGIW